MVTRQPDFDEEDMRRAVAVANAVMAARRHDPLRSACGLAYFATVLADGDEQVRVTVAYVMLQLALELDPDLASILKWH
jgi:hypothetical protein